MSDEVKVKVLFLAEMRHALDTARQVAGGEVIAAESREILKEDDSPHYEEANLCIHVSLLVDNGIAEYEAYYMSNADSNETVQESLRFLAWRGWRGNPEAGEGDGRGGIPKSIGGGDIAESVFN